MNASRQQLVAIAFSAVILAAISAAAGYWLARPRNDPESSSANAAARPQQPLYWYDPMKPTQHFDRPGKSPFMDMQLVPKYADESAAGEARGLRINPVVVQNLGIRFARVERGPLPQTIETGGVVGFNQRDLAIIQARSSGFVTRVYARAPGDVIPRDAQIVDLLVPEWTGAQSELLVLLRTGDRDLIEAARQRLLLLGMSSDLVSSIESTRMLHTSVTIRSPLAGVLETLDVRDGMAVAPGATLAKINGLGTVWVEAAIPEAQGALAGLGKTATARFTTYPGQNFTGRVIAVLPQVNAETRTVRVRIQLGNADGRLRPGMFSQLRLESGGRTPVLHVPSEAIIHTGTRAMVIVAPENGRFIPTETQVGVEVGGKTVIIEGLTEGQRVVASGQFLIDSEANLQGALARLTGGNAEKAADKQRPEARHD
jgi:Cu(I)/Ag(I) efflux system membrane fusion protein